MSSQTFFQPQLTEAAINLGKNLISTETYLHYQQAEQALNSDVTARGLLNNLALTQTRVRKAQSSGTITPEDLQALNDLQVQAQANPIITNYDTSRQELVKFLQEINSDISALLGINFALIARHSSCC
jgi:cell fate (sporulation/competence/biofilm development) regulator YlbF (YheA/YmcA/DUF963 family)